jgi:nicotinate phosphoribosyltransferase
MGEIRPLLERVMEGGRRVGKMPGLEAVRAHRQRSLASMDHTFLRFLNPHIYKVSISGGLRAMKLDFLERYRNAMHAGS